MKYNFEFSGVSFNSGQKDLVIILEKEVELVATFLMSDVQGDPDYAIEKLENVLNLMPTHTQYKATYQWGIPFLQYSYN